MKNFKESDDDYQDVILEIGKSHRVILCKDDIQWILQKSDGMRSGRRRWTGFRYITSRTCLIAACRRLEGFLEVKHLPILEQLPLNHRSRL